MPHSVNVVVAHDLEWPSLVPVVAPANRASPTPGINSVGNPHGRWRDELLAANAIVPAKE